MKKIMIAAMESTAGKTTLSCALMNTLKKHYRVAAFKCGPDYIDPMFHSRVLGIKSRNLDVFLMGEDGVRRTFAGAVGDIAIIESAMGFYDGVSGGVTGSGWDISRILDVPVVLAVRPHASGITLAAQIKGICDFRNNDNNSSICGVVLMCADRMRYDYYRPMIEKECNIPVIGFLPKLKEAEFPSRHLGLYTADEIEDLKERTDAISEQLEKCCDIEGLMELMGDDRCSRESVCAEMTACDTARVCCGNRRPTIAVAYDEAFCFYYEDNFDALRAAGAELSFFSPIRDEHIPDADALYIGGGYPENYLEELSENISMRSSIREAVEDGMPVAAECGGFLYLGQSLRPDNGRIYPMAGALDACGYDAKRLVRFGYATLEAKSDSMLFRAGERVNIHEFHYWEATDLGCDLFAQKPNGKSWECAFVSETMYAGFCHLYFNADMAERFVEAAAGYGSGASDP